MQLILYFVTFVAGLLLTIQVGLNATLGRAVGNLRFAVFMNFLVGLTGLMIFFAAGGGGAWLTAYPPQWPPDAFCGIRCEGVSLRRTGQQEPRVRGTSARYFR